MSHEHKMALERIVALIEKSRQLPTKRMERVFDISLEALGLTKNQRQAEIQRVREATIQLARDKRDRWETRNAE